MQYGWVKVPRAMLGTVVFQHAHLLRLYFWLLFRAAYKDHSVLVGLQKVDLKTGQLVFGSKAAASDLEIPKSTLWRHMKALEQLGLITIDSNPKFSIVELCGNLEWPTDETNAETNKKEKKEKKGKNNIFARKRNGFFNYTDEQQDFSEVEARALQNRRKIQTTT